MTFVYLDSSVLVAIALGDARGTQAVAVVGSRDSCTSALHRSTDVVQGADIGVVEGRYRSRFPFEA